MNNFYSALKGFISVGPKTEFSSNKRFEDSRTKGYIYMLLFVAISLFATDGFCQTITTTAGFSTYNNGSFGYQKVSTTSASPLSFTVAGSSLSNSIVIHSSSTEFQLSTVSASGYSTSDITLTQSGGTVSSTTIYVKFVSTATSGVKTGTLTISSTGATSKTLLVNGNSLATAAFTPGNIAAVRIGGTTSSANAVFIDEYNSTPSSIVSTLTLPTTTSSPNNRITESGSATSDAQLTRSPSGRYLLLSGYDAATGTASVTGTNNKVIAIIDSTGSINSSTDIATGTSSNNTRGATTDGTNIWVSAASGLYATTFGATGSSFTTLLSTNTRQAFIYNGQLYASGSTTFNSVGSGLPTSTGQTLTGLITGLTAVYQYFICHVSGKDVLYISDFAASGFIRKYYWSGTTWTAVNSAAVSNPMGITGIVSGSSVKLFYITGTGSANTLNSITDNAGPTGNLTIGTPGTVTCASGNTFRGLANTPSPTAITTSAASIAFGDVAVNTSSTATAINIGTSYMTTADTITLPAGVQADTTDGTFGTPLTTIFTLPNHSSNIYRKVYFRYTPGASMVTLNSNITISAYQVDGTSVSKNIAVTGYGVVAATASTGAVTGLSTTGATFNGTVNPGNGTTTINFTYPSTVAATPSSIASGVSTNTAVNAVVTGLSVNTQYTYNVSANNVTGTTTSVTPVSFYTLANVPTAPSLGNATVSSLDVSIGSGDGNPAITTYAIQDTASSNYVQSNGTLSASAVYQTAATWGTKTISGLSTNVKYGFKVIAKNGAGTATAYSGTVRKYTL
ncbi:MAG: hypothetical protein WCG87_05665, partial [Bacteroidota bacterium]